MPSGAVVSRALVPTFPRLPQPRKHTMNAPVSTWRADLLWFFANEHIVCSVSSLPLDDEAAIGSGNRGTKGVYHEPDPDLDAMVRWGAISRVLHRLEATTRLVLELAYGDVGAAVTEGSVYTDRRWRALAAISKLAREHAHAFAPKRPSVATTDERARDTTCGSRAAHWANDLLGKKTPSDEERALLVALRAECSERLTAAEEAYRAAERDHQRGRPVVSARFFEARR